jgi:S-adenosylmethionine:tRNA ribosyltransferase-isomerase
MELKLDDFLYDLPKDRIADKPLQNREDSKLLLYHKGFISDHTFKDFPSLLTEDFLMVFNNTKVIPARLIFFKETGAAIEIFLLEPLNPVTHEAIMAAEQSCSWKCMIGNAKKWKLNTTLQDETGMSVTRTGENEVTFTWEGMETFSEKLVAIGKIPLPPYLEREVEEWDKERYQTVYSRIEGAVAAPTAGLHFTQNLLESIRSKGVSISYLTLHVSAGTFQPIKEDRPENHPMHKETLWITQSNILDLLKHKKRIAVGTTSMRSMESLYWYGVKLGMGDNVFNIEQTDPYRLAAIDTEKALRNVLDFMKEQNLEKISGQTGIYIYPGYTF